MAHRKVLISFNDAETEIEVSIHDVVIDSAVYDVATDAIEFSAMIADTIPLSRFCEGLRDREKWLDEIWQRYGKPAGAWAPPVPWTREIERTAGGLEYTINIVGLGSKKYIFDVAAQTVEFPARTAGTVPLATWRLRHLCLASLNVEIYHFNSLYEPRAYHL